MVTLGRLLYFEVKDKQLKEKNYLANEKKFTIENGKVKTPILSSRSSVSYYLEGDNLESIKIKKVATTGDLELSTGKLSWGNENVTGKYTIDDFFINSDYDGEMVYNDYNIAQYSEVDLKINSEDIMESNFNLIQINTSGLNSNLKRLLLNIGYQMGVP